MITAMRCDRCGAETNAEGAQRMAWVRRGEGAFLVSWQLMGHPGGTSRTAAHLNSVGGDLCAECMAEFRAWWRRGKDIGWADNRS